MIPLTLGAIVRECLLAAHAAGHPQVEDRDSERLLRLLGLLEELQCFHAVAGEHYVVAEPLEHSAEDIPNDEVVVHNQDASSATSR